MSQNARAVALVLVAVGILFILGAAYTSTHPTTQTFTEEQNQQTISVQTTTASQVTGNTTLYERGEWISNKSTYFLTISPNLTLLINVSVPANQEVNVMTNLHMEISGVRQEEPFYEKSQSLLNTTHSVRDGTVHASPVIHIAELNERLAQIQTETQGVGEYNVRFILEVVYDTSQYEGTIRTTTPLIISGRAYYLSQQLSENQTRATLIRRQIQRPPSPVAYGGLALGGLVLFGLSAVVLRIEELADPERLRTQIIHDRHDEWISRGEFPTNSEKQYIHILSLEDLVDVAIDTNRRVIHDPNINAYAVIDESEIYYYSLDDTNTDEWLEI